MSRPMNLLMTSIFLIGCSARDLLPLEPPPGGSLLRCSKAEAQASGSVVAIGGRVDSCQCVGAGPGFGGRLSVELPGCKLVIEPVTP